MESSSHPLSSRHVLFSTRPDNPGLPSSSNKNIITMAESWSILLIAQEAGKVLWAPPPQLDLLHFLFPTFAYSSQRGHPAWHFYSALWNENLTDAIPRTNSEVKSIDWLIMMNNPISMICISTSNIAYVDICPLDYMFWLLHIEMRMMLNEV